MSLFNPLIWLFFIPALVFFLVMYLSQLSVVSFLLTFTQLSIKRWLQASNPCFGVLLWLN